MAAISADCYGGNFRGLLWRPFPHTVMAAISAAAMAAIYTLSKTVLPPMAIVIGAVWTSVPWCSKDSVRRGSRRQDIGSYGSRRNDTVRGGHITAAYPEGIVFAATSK